MTTLAIQKPLSGGMVFRWLAAAFGLIVGVNAVMIFLALTSFSGETETKSYAAGLDYNQTLARVAAQKSLGWRVSGGVAPMDGGVIKVAVTLTDAAGKPIDGLDAVATFMRPTVEGADFTIALAGQGGGLYTATATPALPGRWHVRAAFVHGDAEPFIIDFPAPRRRRPVR